jgi:hypothetical protein
VIELEAHLGGYMWNPMQALSRWWIYVDPQCKHRVELFIHALYYACVTTASSDSFDLRLDAIELGDEVDFLAR